MDRARLVTLAERVLRVEAESILALARRGRPGARTVAHDPRAALPPRRADAVAALSRLSPAERDAMGGQGRAFYQQELSLARGVERFEAVFAAAGTPC